MTSEGSAYSRFRRAVERGNSRAIRLAARELSHEMSLDDALEVCLVLLEREPQVYPRAAARWCSRLVLERSLGLDEAQLLLAALATLPGDASARSGALAVVEIAHAHGVRRAGRILERWLERASWQDRADRRGPSE